MFTPLGGFAVAVAVLVVANLLNNRWAPWAYVPTSLVTAALLLGVFRLAGFAWSDAGLGRAEAARGARWALVLVTLVAAGCLVGALLPVTRTVFMDRRVEQAGVGSAAYQVLVRIPLGTVVLEEVAFRGVLYGLLRPDGIAWATGVSSLLFGLWHVLPARELPKLNPAVGRMFDARSPVVVAAAVIATALAGVVLCELRRRSGSLLAPIGVHWAFNALGFVTALVVTRWRGRT